VSLFRFIAAEKANYSISLMCCLLGVSCSGFHAWERRRGRIALSLMRGWSTKSRQSTATAAAPMALAGSTPLRVSKASTSGASGSSR
jgi:hypothetical protein